MQKMEIKELAAKLLSFKDNIKVIIGVLVVLLLLDATILLQGQLFPLMRLFSKARQLKADVIQAKDDINFASSYKSKLAEYSTELLELEKKVILEEGLPNALEQISKYADSSNVKILKMMPVNVTKDVMKLSKQASDSAETSQEFFKQGVSLTVKAGFHQLGRFLALLESSKVFFRVQKLEIQTTEQEPSKQLVTLVLELVVRKA
ncbi:MAG: hypothetical protein ABIC68_03510 [Candidatus Omnitrophota bacterium]